MNLRTLWREPLLHFVLLGAAIFGLSAPDAESDDAPAVQAQPERTAIVVDDGLRERLADDYLRLHGAPPTAEQLENFVDAWVVEEALYREALLLGLDRGDEIVRRRLVQKMRFVTDGVAAVDEPTDDELTAFLDAHTDDYQLAARVGFEHVYFSSARRGDAALDDCRAFLASAGDGAPSAGTGDPFVHGGTFANHALSEVGARFGRPFVEAITSAPMGLWYGPVPSTTGYHAVVVHAAVPARHAELDEVRDRVTADWRTDRRRERSADALETLVAAYGVDDSEGL